MVLKRAFTNKLVLINISIMVGILSERFHRVSFGSDEDSARDECMDRLGASTFGVYSCMTLANEMQFG